MYVEIILFACLLFAVESSAARRGYRRSNAGHTDELSAACISGIVGFRRQCHEMPSPLELLGAESVDDVYSKLAEADLQLLCGPYQQWFQCFNGAMSACRAEGDPSVLPLIQSMDTTQVIVNYVCDEKLNVLNRHKACLLKREDGFQDSPRSGLMPVIVTSVNRSCYEQIRQLDELATECPFGSSDLQECAIRVVADQCGDEIASVLDGLADRVRTAAGCPSSRLRSTAHLKRRGFSSLTQHFKFMKSLF